MFDVSGVTKRYFTVQIGGSVLEVEPPTLKMLHKLMNMQKGEKQGVMEDLSETLAAILSKNKAGQAITVDFIQDSFNFDQMMELLTAYFKWMGEEKNSPN